MTKFILVVCAVLLVYAVIKGVRRRSKRGEDGGKADKAEPRGNEDMVRCAKCGVHLPRSESLVTQGQHYCSAEHRREHQARP